MHVRFGIILALLMLFYSTGCAKDPQGDPQISVRGVWDVGASKTK